MLSNLLCCGLSEAKHPVVAPCHQCSSQCFAWTVSKFSFIVNIYLALSTHLKKCKSSTDALGCTPTRAGVLPVFIALFNT